MMCFYSQYVKQNWCLTHHNTTTTYTEQLIFQCYYVFCLLYIVLNEVIFKSLLLFNAAGNEGLRKIENEREGGRLLV